MGIPDHLPCLLISLYAGQEATVITGHGTTDCFQIGIGVWAAYHHPAYFYTMRNTGLERAQAGIKIARRNINNLRYADGDCIHEIKRRLLFERKIMANLDSILKSSSITLPTKLCLIKAKVFPVFMYGCEFWTVKKAEC